MRQQNILDKVKIASPCHARWEDMTGSDRARFCGQCSKHVYNFSAMTSQEVKSLIREKEGRLCGRFYRRPDGRMLTADCAVGVRRKRHRLAQLCGAVAGFVLFLLGGCARRGPEVQGMIAIPEEQGRIALQPVMGDIACPPPATNGAMLGEILAPPTK